MSNAIQYSKRYPAQWYSIISPKILSNWTYHQRLYSIPLFWIPIWPYIWFCSPTKINLMRLGTLYIFFTIISPLSREGIQQVFVESRNQYLHISYRENSSEQNTLGMQRWVKPGLIKSFQSTHGSRHKKLDLPKIRAIAKLKENATETHWKEKLIPDLETSLKRWHWSKL